MPSKKSHQQGIAAREIVFKILRDFETKQENIRDSLSKHLDNSNPRDIGLIQEICYGVVRWKLLLDYNINLYSKKEVKHQKTLLLMRMTAYQLFYLNSIPSYAALSTGVDLIKKYGNPFLAKFANAVFRKLQTNGLQHPEGNSLKALSINHSHPLWLLKRWNKKFSTDQLLKILRENNNQNHFWIRFNTLKTNNLQLNSSEESSKSSIDFPYSLQNSGISEIIKSKRFENGELSIQSPSSWIATQLLNVQPGDRVLDLCAAPGGKSACIIEQTKGKVNIVSADISYRRIIKIKDVQNRLSHKLLPIVMDGKNPALKTAFDKVFIDAPCSNLGVIRRKPEVKWKQTPDTLKNLNQIQYDILKSVDGFTKKGSIVVYATCSPDSHETQDVIDNFLSNFSNWKLIPADKFISSEFVKNKYFWIYPGETKFDGFFAARLEKIH